MITDAHLGNLCRQIREALQANNPVMAYTWLWDLEEYLATAEHPINDGIPPTRKRRV